MNVLIASFFARHNGGINSHIQDLSKELKSRGVPHQLLQNPLSKPILPQRLLAFKRVLRQNPFAFFREKFRTEQYKISITLWKRVLDQRIRQMNPSVIHLHEPVSAYSISGKKFLLTIHSFLSGELSFSLPNSPAFIFQMKKMEQSALEKAGKIIAVDTWRKETISREYGISPQKIRFIPNAVDIGLFHPSNIFHSEPEPYFFIPRRLEVFYGIHVALKALKSLKSSHLHIKIAGDGPEKENLKKLAEALQLGNRVEFIQGKSREELIPFYQRAIGVIIPSIPYPGIVEATSISALEGMACSKVVIGSNIGGIKELITDGYSGLLFDAGNEAELAKKMELVNADANLRKRLSETARAVVEKSYSTKKWILKVLEEYHGLENSPDD